jgi:hypothetical protein
LANTHTRLQTKKQVGFKQKANRKATKKATIAGQTAAEGKDRKNRKNSRTRAIQHDL